MLFLGDEFVLVENRKHDCGRGRVAEDVIVRQHQPAGHVDQRPGAARDAVPAAADVVEDDDPDGRFEHALVDAPAAACILVGARLRALGDGDAGECQCERANDGGADGGYAGQARHGQVPDWQCEAEHVPS